MRQNSINYRSILLGASVVLALALASPMFGETAPASVANKAYQVTVKSSFGTSFNDCFRFVPGNIFEIDGCGDEGPYGEQPILGTTFVTGFAGKVPCQGLNLQWFGSSVFGANFPSGQGADLISAVAVGEAEGTTFTVSGFAVNTCPRSAARNGVNYQLP